MIRKILLARQKRQQIASLSRLKESFLMASLVQIQVLEEILEHHKNTEWHQQFQSLNSKNFRDIVSLTTYENYEETIEKIAQTGNYNLLVAEPIQFFQLTSGASGKQKRIPRTSSLAKTFAKAVQAIDGTRYSYFKGNHLTVGLINTKPLQTTPSGIPMGTGTSGGLRRLLKSRFLKWLLQSSFVEPVEAFLIEDPFSSYYIHLLYALANPNLEVISTNFAASVLEAFQILEKEYPSFLHSLKTKELPTSVSLEPEIIPRIFTSLKIKPERLRFLENEFNKGFHEIAPRIWKKLRYVQANSTGTMEIYQERLPYYIGNIPIYSAGYGSSEAWVGVNLTPNSFPVAYTVLPQCAFYEFIPLSTVEEEQPKTLLLEELNKGDIYEVVVTTIGGLYRYRLGDLVQCLEYEGQSPRLQFLYRRQELLNIAGEKMPVALIYEGLKQSLANELIDYTTTVNTQDFPAFYQIFVESQSTLPPHLDLLLDLYLQDHHLSYKAYRQEGRIGKLQITLVAQETFKQFKQLKTKEGDNQFKMPRIIKIEDTLLFRQNSQA